MNRIQTIVLWIGIAIVVLMCLFPPLIGSYHDKRQIHYEFILKGPISYDSSDYQYRNRTDLAIDINRLIVQCGIVAIITSGLICTLRFRFRTPVKNWRRGLRRITLLCSVLMALAGASLVCWWVFWGYSCWGEPNNDVILLPVLGFGVPWLVYLILVGPSYWLVRAFRRLFSWVAAGFQDSVTEQEPEVKE